MMLQMKTQLNSHQASKARTPKELAVLFKRFSINSRNIISQIPITMRTQFAQKIAFLETQITDSENQFRFQLQLHLNDLISNQRQQQPQTVAGYPIGQAAATGASTTNLYPGVGAYPSAASGVAANGYSGLDFGGGSAKFTQAGSQALGYPGLSGQGNVGYPPDSFQMPAGVSSQSKALSYPNATQPLSAQKGFISQDLNASYSGMQCYGQQNPTAYQTSYSQAYTYPGQQTQQQNFQGYSQQQPYPAPQVFPSTLPPQSTEVYNYQPTQPQQVQPQIPQPSALTNKSTSSLRSVYCPLEIVESFIRLADANTKKLVETCAILAGNEKNGVLVIDTLIIPQQNGAHDHCYMTDEIELFQTQIENNVMTLGWIHTHPQYSLFLSSVDLHNQLGYQLQMPEAVAIVYSPIEKDRYKAFRVKNERVGEIAKCEAKGFHEHKDTTGRFAWEECQHIVYLNGAENGIKSKTIELRK